MKVEEVIKGELYATNNGLVVKSTGRVDKSEGEFSGRVIRNSPILSTSYVIGSIHNNWSLTAFSPLSEESQVSKNEVKEERLESASREIWRILNNKFIKSIKFSNKVKADGIFLDKPKVKFTFIHNKIKFDSLQALQDTLDHLHDLNQDTFLLSYKVQKLSKRARRNNC